MDWNLVFADIINKYKSDESTEINLAKQLNDKANYINESTEINLAKQLNDKANYINKQCEIKKTENYLVSEKLIKSIEWPKIIKTIKQLADKGIYSYKYYSKDTFDFKYGCLSGSIFVDEITELKMLNLIQKMAINQGFRCDIESNSVLIRWDQQHKYNLYDIVVLHGYEYEVQIDNHEPYTDKCYGYYLHQLHTDDWDNDLIFKKLNISDQYLYIENIVDYEVSHGAFPCVKTLEDLNKVIHVLQSEKVTS